MATIQLLHTHVDSRTGIPRTMARRYDLESQIGRLFFGQGAAHRVVINRINGDTDEWIVDTADTPDEGSTR